MNKYIFTAREDYYFPDNPNLCWQKGQKYIGRDSGTLLKLESELGGDAFLISETRQWFFDNFDVQEVK